MGAMSGLNRRRLNRLMESAMYGSFIKSRGKGKRPFPGKPHKPGKKKAKKSNWKTAQRMPLPSLTKTIRNAMSANGQHNVQQNDHFYFSLKNKKVHKHLKLPQSFISHSYQTVIKGSAGVREYFELGAMLTRGQFITAPQTSALEQSLNVWPINPFDINPNQFNTGNAITNSKYINATDFVYISHIDGEFTLTNFQNTGCHCEIWVTTPKVGTDSSPKQLFAAQAPHLGWLTGAGASETGTAGPNVTISGGYGTALGQATPGYPTVGAWFFSPFILRDVRSVLKQKAYKKFELAAGDSRRIKVRFYIHKLFSKANMATQTDEYIKGLTHSITLRTRGANVRVQSSATSSLAVTSSDVELGYTMQYKVNCHHPVMNQRWQKGYADGHLPYVSVASHAANTNIMEVINDVDAITQVLVPE